MTPDQALTKARKLAKSGAAPEAIALYQQVLDRYPQNKKARKELNALQKLAPATDKQGYMAQDLQSLVDLYSTGKTDRALAQAKHLCKVYPNQPLPFNIIGVIQIQRGNYESAVKNCSKALGLEPSYGDALNNLGSALHKLKRHDEARACYQRLLSIQGEDPDAFFNLANVFRDTENFESAAACYQRSIQIRPLYSPAQIGLGRCLIKTADFPGALKCFQKAIELDNQSIEAHCGIGELLLGQNRPQEALSWYGKAVELDAGNLASKYGMARALTANGEIQKAIPLMKEYLKSNPDNSEVKHLLDAAQNNTTKVAPRQYIETAFNANAKGFEEHLTETLGYRAPAQLRELLTDADQSSVKPLSAADLGCGTGLVGDAFRDTCSSLIGLDLSAKMLEIAKEKEIYDELLLGDIVETLRDLDKNFDLFVSADTLIYIGDLQPLFDAVAQRSANGTLFIFSTEISDRPGYTLLHSGRYAHGDSYVKETLDRANFELLRRETLPLRKERDEWLQGGFYLARYSGG
ncbi:MAG: tetratricopeptide repeat protein [Halioglobus sp.]